MAKRVTTMWNGGTGIAMAGTGVLSIWSPMTGVLIAGVILLLALTVAVVVLTAARGRDEKQRNSAALLDRLVSVIFRKGPPGS